MESPTLNSAGEPIVLVERRGHIGIVRMNRPEAMNAMSADLRGALATTWEEHEADPDIWVHIVTGVGDRAFCAGADLKEAAATGMMVNNRIRVTEMSANTVGFGGVTPLMKKPIIAAVNGYALGGGCELVLACDLIVAEEQAQLGLTEVRRGLVAGGGGMYRLPRRIPPTIALEAIMTGVPLTAQRAYEVGLVNRLVPIGQGVEAAVEIAELICEGSPAAVRYSRAVARAAFSIGDQEAKDTAPELREAWWNSGDMSEGPRAFAEKRKPNWSS
jgi:enoyl-CoA hydratase/carnithine racemase